MTRETEASSETDVSGAADARWLAALPGGAHAATKSVRYSSVLDREQSTLEVSRLASFRRALQVTVPCDN